jgi:hypothetical protein
VSHIQLVTVIVPELAEFVREEGTDGSCIEISASGSPVTIKLPGLCIPPTAFTVPVADLIPMGVNTICPPDVSGENWPKLNSVVSVAVNVETTSAVIWPITVTCAGRYWVTARKTTTMIRRLVNVFISPGFDDHQDSLVRTGYSKNSICKKATNAAITDIDRISSRTKV